MKNFPNIIFKLFYCFIVSLFFFSCAQIVNPSGGPKDTRPPRAVKYIPDSAAKNFSAKNIAIVFNEYIQVGDLQKQLLISPPMNIQPDVKAKGKMLLIEVKDTLKKNTTYTFNFGNSIRDFTEGNMLEDFQYVFSTGNYIDSLKLSGTVKNAFDGKTDKGILVMLYDSYDDSVPYKKLPSYFGKTNADGSYKINNIRAGTYKAFALKDINSNYLYDSPEELIGFSDTLIKISGNTSLNLILFKEEPVKQKLKKATFAERGHIVFSFSKRADSLQLKFLSNESKENVVYEFSKEKDTLHYWFAGDIKDTLKIIVSEKGKNLDTVRLRPITPEITKISARGNKWMLIPFLNVSKDKPFDYKKDVIIKFNHPIKEAKPDLINLSAGDKKINYTNEKFSDEVKRNFFFSFPLNQDSSYKLFIPPATFTDIFGLKNDTIKINFKTQEEKYYGTLKLTLKIKNQTKYILQLMNEKGEIVDYANSDKEVFMYTFLPPGSYKIRIIYDKNGDDNWTTGNYLQKRKPETVIYYSNPITIRSNWDLELEWKAE
ncbi:MAG: Ig-like domain-containing protein [Bacteroidetes bacterium]|nr:Ig-like domain-containing protein [Bacteroidota bacterium]